MPQTLPFPLVRYVPTNLETLVFHSLYKPLRIDIPASHPQADILPYRKRRPLKILAVMRPDQVNYYQVEVVVLYSLGTLDQQNLPVNLPVLSGD